MKQSLCWDSNPLPVGGLVVFYKGDMPKIVGLRSTFFSNTHVFGSFPYKM